MTLVGLPTMGATPVMAAAAKTVEAELRELGGRRVSWFRVRGGDHRGALAASDAAVAERAVVLGRRVGIPIVGILDTSGAEIGDGVAALHGWGRVARALADASGSVPTVLAVVGPCVSGPALLLGLVDVAVLTEDAFAYVSGPTAVAEVTGLEVTAQELGGASGHARQTGVAWLVLPGERDVEEHLAWLLGHLPDNCMEPAPRAPSIDPPDRPCEVAARTIPDSKLAGYDVRDVVADVLDRDSLLELRARYAPNLVTALGRLDGRSVGVVANQPRERAGTLDIEASRKAARFVSWCDAFNVPLLTFVDTPGFEPGRDLEWRGMIRHGAELVYAYGEATVPRCCVVLRKAYGGAYIVMDSRGLGNDLCFAWPTAEIAVMGAPGAVQVLHGRRLGSLDDGERVGEEARLVAEYEDTYLNPWKAAERGVVDAVIDPADTRRLLAEGLASLEAKDIPAVARRHGNTPL